MPRIFISDSTAGGTHGALIKAAILANNPNLVDADITLQLNASYNLPDTLTDLATAFNGGYEAFVHSTTFAPSLHSYAQTYWEQGQTLRIITPLGDNNHLPVTYSPNERNPQITCGASDGAANETGYGPALWFFDDDNDGNPADASSFSAGVIAGKLLYIKDQRSCTWWEAIYAALQTASGGGTATLNDGYGKIDVDAAIEWRGTVPWDWYLPIGSVGSFSGSNVASVATLTPTAVDNATQYYLERNTGEGWEVVDVKNSSAAFTISLTANVATSFRYRASNGGGITEYSSTVELEWTDLVALKRQSIISAVKTRMQLINGAGNYYLNVSSNVYIQRDAPFETWNDREVPGVNIVDTDEELDQQLMSGASNVWYRSLAVAITLVTNGALADTNVRKGIADIQRAIGTDLTWGALAIDTNWIGTTLEKDQQEQRILSATVNIRILYSTVQWSEE